MDISAILQTSGVTPSELGAEGAGEDARSRWLATFVREHSSSAQRTAYRLLRNPDDARDAVQESLAIAFQRYSELKTGTSADAWFFRILVNHCLGRLRRQRVRDRALQLLGVGPRTAKTETDHLDFSENVLPQLLALPLKQRTALILRFGDDRSLDEIAAALGVSRETVKTHLRRGLRSLRSRMSRGEDA